MIDIGANLSHEQFKNDLSQVLQSAYDKGVSEIILTSTDTTSFQKNLNIIQSHSKVKNTSTPTLTTTLGLHPHHASEHVKFFELFEIEKTNTHIKALGEFGLDYFRMISPKNTQLDVMNKFLEYAATPELSHLPLFLHERDSFPDFLSVLQNHKVSNPHIVHCFTGNTSNLKSYLDNDCYIGITGWISDTKRGTELRAALQYLPLERMLIETDAPYLAPKNMGVKTYRNEPAYLIFTAMEIANIKKITVEEVIAATTLNAQKLFHTSLQKKNNLSLK